MLAISAFNVQVAGTDNVLEARNRFQTLGLKTFTEDNTECCYAVQDKVWIEDPDGNSWEVFVVKADAAVMCSETSACCAPIAGDSAKPAGVANCCAGACG